MELSLLWREVFLNLDLAISLGDRARKLVLLRSAFFRGNLIRAHGFGGKILFLGV